MSEQLARNLIELTENMGLDTCINIIGICLIIVFAHYIWLVETNKYLRSERDYYKKAYFNRLEFKESRYSHVKSYIAPQNTPPVVYEKTGFLIKEAQNEQD